MWYIAGMIFNVGAHLRKTPKYIERIGGMSSSLKYT
jgi:hypothetical protein